MGHADRSVWQRLEGRRQQVLEAIAAAADAQQSLVTGRYGWCQRCGGQIPDDRLEVRPTTTRCVACADLR